MAATPMFNLGVGQSPGQLFYQTVSNNVRDGYLTNVSALLSTGAGAKKMDKPKQAGRSKHKYIDSVLIGGKAYGNVPMSYVASDNYPTYALAAQLLSSADGQDYSVFVQAFAQQFGTGKVQSGKGKVVGKGFIDLPAEWKNHGNAVLTSSLTPKSPAKSSSSAASSSAPVAGFGGFGGQQQGGSNGQGGQQGGFSGQTGFAGQQQTGFGGQQGFTGFAGQGQTGFPQQQ